MTTKNEEKRIKEAMDNVDKGGIKPEDELNFKCDSCGICCRNIDIILSPLDILRVRKALVMPTMEILSEYTTMYPGENSKIPVCLLKFNKINEDTTVCPFLLPEFFEEFNKEAKKRGLSSGSLEFKELVKEFSKKHLDFKMIYFKQKESSLPCNKECFNCKRTVEQHLKDNNLEEFSHLQEEYNLFLSEAASYMIENEEIQKIPEVFNSLLGVMYNFDSVMFVSKMLTEKGKKILEGTSLNNEDVLESLKKMKDSFVFIPEIDVKLFDAVRRKESTKEDMEKAYAYLISLMKETLENIKEKYDKASKN